MKSLLNKFVRFWTGVIGKEYQYTLECRIFNAVSILAAITASVNAGVNFALGLAFYGFIMLPLIALLIFGYFLSRFKNRLSIAIGLFAIAFNLLCGITYFVSEASGGVNLFTFILIVFILTIVSDHKQFWIWIPFTLIVIAGLFFTEYQYPELVKQLYDTRQARLLDHVQTVFEVLLMITIITVFVKKSYYKEKWLAEQRFTSLEEINETKNKLFSIVAHDLNAPLSSIENYLSILNHVEMDAEEKASIEKSLLVSTKLTSEMLQNILSWSKDQMGGTLVNLKSVPIHDALYKTIQLKETLAKEKHITLVYVPQPHLVAMADTDLLQLIIRNLLNNAIKFCHNGGTILLETIDQDSQCLIRISDNGIGIGEEEKSQIFSLKHKGTYGTNKEKGVGLGLTLAKTYTDLQHGQIWFESEIGKGTTFYVSLPKPHFNSLS
ncbi:HAMP domain-containing sensor histidine kinase [Pedobacter sp. KR3-3]|uniref:histidine kinase n=1 Tax=Pedobacter albus TaxID=3113905 RepID=A0ABU7I7H1_9SPHI|nr:HAMP domain-containing sensor histidine kinase [Pedobacter sp. KR3-3]MEE1945398.1 HAMP domain-containing sensor histidine kinase [Pedobacter sp. KR3-3]